MDGTAQTVSLYFLKTPDGMRYGPVDIATLCTWATDARVIPGCVLSSDQVAWTPVESYPELRLNWSVQFVDGTIYGPLNLLAIWVLASEQSIPNGVTLVEKETRRRVVLDDSIHSLLLEECRLVLTGCGRLMAEAVSRLVVDRNRAVDQLADREGCVTELQARLAKSEADLAVNLKLIAETQRHLSEAQSFEAKLDAQTNENDALRASLVSARMTLAERDTQLETLRMRLGDADNELAVNRKLVAETQRRLAEYAALAAVAGAGNHENEVLCRSLASAKVDLADREAQLEVLHARVSNCEADLKAERELVAELKTKLSETQLGLNNERQRAELAEQARSGLLLTLAERDEAAATLRESLSGLTLQLETSHAKAGQLARVVDEKAALESDLREQQRQLTELRQELVDSIKTGEALRLSEQQMRNRINELEDSLLAVRSVAEAAAAKARDDEDKLALLNSEKERIGSDVLRLREDLQQRDSLILKLESTLAVAHAEADKQVSLIQSRLEMMQQSFQAEQERGRKESEALAHLRIEVESLTTRQQSLQAELTNKEIVARKLESTLAVQRAEADRQLSVLRSKNSVLEKDLQLAKQNTHALAIQLTQAKDLAVKARKASRDSDQKLKDEIAAIQSDLNGLMLASQCVHEVVDQSKPAYIDWTVGGEARPDTSTDAISAQSRFEQIPFQEKLALLQKELQASAQQKESLRRDLESVSSRYELLSNDLSRSGRDAEEKLAQLRAELKTTSDLLAKAMQEIEKRESIIRDLRKKTGGAGGLASTSPSILEAEVIHAVNLGPDEITDRDPKPVIEPGPVDQGEGAHPGRILNSVEAQLQHELKKWETLKRENEKKDGTLGRWFRRKTS